MSYSLYCGDCLELMQSIPTASVDLILCDLPYGMTVNKWDSIIPLDRLWPEYKRIAKPTAAIVLTAMQPFASRLIMSNPKMFRYEWTWSKSQGTGFLNAKKQPLRSHEQVLVFYAKQPTYNPQMRHGFKPYKSSSTASNTPNYGEFGAKVSVSEGDRYPITVLEFPYDFPKLHPTQKPVALMEYMIRTYTNPGDTVLDNCMGSGTTGVACLKTDRNFIGMELDPAYFAISAQRIRDVELANLTPAA